MFLSTEKRVFTLLKIAKIYPIFKSSNASDVSNYRPISALPIFSKVLERITYSRFFDYLHKNKLVFKRGPESKVITFAQNNPFAS